jgi:hypothetical protein
MQVFVVLLRFFGNDGKEKRLLPCGRLAGAIKPSVGRLAWTTQSGNDHGGGIRGERISEGHGQILPHKKKYAMRKIILAQSPQCGYGNRMSAQQYAEAVIATALHNGMTIEQIAKMDPKELAQAHLHTQNKATDAAAKQILAEMK